MIPLMVPILRECMPGPLLGRSSGLVLFAFGVGPAVGYAITGRYICLFDTNLPASIWQ